MRQPHTPRSILLLDGLAQQDHLARSIVDQSRYDFSHQRFIVQSDIPELFPVQDGRAITKVHDFIVPACP